MRAGQNFLKHARDDPDGEFDLNAAETEDLLFFATMNAGEVDAISDAESVFQFWYLAVRSVNLPGDFPFVREALEYFSGIIAMTPGEQRTFGATRLAEELKGDA
jgi:hypothetical protein